MGSRGEASVGAWETKSPEAVCRHCLQILTAELQKQSKFKNFAQLTPWFLTSMFYGEANRHIGA